MREPANVPMVRRGPSEVRGLRGEQYPVWVSVLFAAGCVARSRGSARPIAWEFDGEQAFYTNSHSEAVVVDPFDFLLNPGESLAILWERGETSYRLRKAAEC